MRWLAVALLLANVGLAAWALNARLGQPARPLPAPGSDGPVAMRLLEELDALPPLREGAEPGRADRGAAQPPGPVARTAPAPESGAEAPADAGGEAGVAASADPDAAGAGEDARAAAALFEPAACARIGPLRDVARVEALERWFAGRPVSLQRRVEDGPQRKLFWVYLEPSGSEAQAHTRLDDLRRRGVEDYMLVRRGGLKNAISLGLFSSQESVNRRLAELADQGYRPVVVPRHEAERLYWLDLGLPGAEALEQLMRAAPTEATVREVDCSELRPPPAVNRIQDGAAGTPRPPRPDS